MFSRAGGAALDRELLQLYSRRPAYQALRKMGATREQLLEAMPALKDFAKHVAIDQLQAPDLLRRSEALVVRDMARLEKARGGAELMGALNLTGSRLQLSAGHLFTPGAEDASPGLLRELGRGLRVSALAKAHLEGALRALEASPSSSVELSRPMLFGALELLTRTDPAVATRLGTRLFTLLPASST